MAVNDVRWGDRFQGYDIHVLASALPNPPPSRTLNDLLVIDHGTPSTAQFAKDVPTSIATTAFIPEFDGAPSAHGVTVNTANGEVTVATPLPATPLRNFLIRAEVTDHTGAAPVVHPTRPKIRIHVHTAITGLLLTPNPLTIRRNADGQRFTVLAEFDDGTVGDLTRMPGITWTPFNPPPERGYPKPPRRELGG